MKLDERDERVLAHLGTRTRSLSALVTGLDAPPDDLATRLADLEDNGLVYDRGEGRYERTESGRRVLLASGAGAGDERIDTTPEIDDVIDGFSLRADEADAVRHAFSFLRYWGRVTREEILDAVYSEAPAGRETHEEWWEDLVREPLAALPGVAEPTEDGGAWRYAGAPEAAGPFPDGRRVLSRTHPVYGDVKHAIESLDLAEAEREAARAAFEFLYRRDETSEATVREAVYPDYPAGYTSPEEWWDSVVGPVFDVLPGVEHAGGSAWRYRRGR